MIADPASDTRVAARSQPGAGAVGALRPARGQPGARRTGPKAGLVPGFGFEAACHHRYVGHLEPERSRRALCAALPLWAALPLLAAEPLPQRNLIVELRLVDQATVIHGAAAADSASIDSRGNMHGSVGALNLGATQRAGQGVQSVRVLNGGQARMQVVQTQALVGAVAAWSGYRPGPPGPQPWGPSGGRPPVAPGHPGDGPAGAVATAWAELVEGFEVRPRWPGGQAPVTIEVGARRSAGPTTGNSPAPRIDLFTTLLAPVGEWTELAQVQRGASTTVSSGRATVGTQRALQLQLRVTLAD
jgi:hypothetical protein